MNGLRVAERIIQGKGDAVHEDWEGAIFDKNGWEYINDYNEVEGMSFKRFLDECSDVHFDRTS